PQGLGQVAPDVLDDVGEPVRAVALGVAAGAAGGRPAGRRLALTGRGLRRVIAAGRRPRLAAAGLLLHLPPPLLALLAPRHAALRLRLGTALRLAHRGAAVRLGRGGRVAGQLDQLVDVVQGAVLRLAGFAAGV